MVLYKNPYNCDMIFIFKLLPIIAAVTPESTVSSGVARRTQGEPAVGKKPVRLRRSGIEFSIPSSLKDIINSSKVDSQMP